MRIKVLYATLAALIAAIGVVAFFNFTAVSKAQNSQKINDKMIESKFKKTLADFSRVDNVTKQIREPKNQVFRVNVKDINDTEKISRAGEIIEDYGSFILVSANSMSTELASGFEVQKLETSINLPGSSFEPLSNKSASSAGDALRSGEKGYFIVQFGGIAKQEWLEALTDAGVEIVQYIPHQAFLVYGDSNAISRAQLHNRVRWIGKYEPEHKLSDHVDQFMADAKGGTQSFDVAVFSRAGLERVKTDIQQSSGARVIITSRLASNFFNVVRVEATPAQIEQIAKYEDVFRVDPFIPSTIEDERAAHIVAGNYTSPTVIAAPGYDPLTQFGVDGTGVTVSVSDDGISIPGNGGFYVTAANTIHGPLRGATAGASGGHGHINASIIAGSTPYGILDPAGYNYGRGVAPGANIIDIPFLKSGNTTTDAQAIDDTLNTLGPNGVRGTISNNSWGNGTNGNSYDSLAAQYDGFVRDGSLASSIDPFTVIFSAGNSGPSANSLTRPKVSKNTIAVANVENVRTELGGTSADNMDDLRSSSSRGPAADGRIKPDIAAPGTVITGSRAGTCGSVSSCFDANHAYSSGTSHAAPQVAAAAALFTQYYRNNNAGVSPLPSLIKASIISSGQDMNGLTTNTQTVPNGIEGWGRINMKYMMNTGVPIKYVNEDVPFTNVGNNYTISGTVGDGSKPVRVTLVWTDPPGAGNPALVNNLDLSVTIGSNSYKGNVFSAGNSSTGGNFDTINNVENVFIPAGVPAGTTYTITVNATALNGDGILANGDVTDQHFSLVAYNFAEESPVSEKARADFDGDAKTDISVFRPSNSTWHVLRSSDNSYFATQFGSSGDVITPGDFDGDGKADVALYRPSQATWYIEQSSAGLRVDRFGTAEDIPAAADFDGDGKTDLALFRPSNGVWYIVGSTQGFYAVQFGASGDKPVVEDYDGDGKADIAVWRPSSGVWYIIGSTAGLQLSQFGLTGDRPVQADYDGDGKADIALWRPSNRVWYLLNSTAGFQAAQFGLSTDRQVPGNFDDDTKTDIGIFRNGEWYLLNSSTGIMQTQFGSSGDIPIASGYIPAP